MAGSRHTIEYNRIEDVIGRELREAACPEATDPTASNRPCRDRGSGAVSRGHLVDLKALRQGVRSRQTPHDCDTCGCANAHGQSPPAVQLANDHHHASFSTAPACAPAPSTHKVTPDVT
jgi:hypothetical protein